MSVLDRLGRELLYLDGGMGSLLQERGLKPGELPETWNILRSEDIIDIHKSYIEAGSRIILTNTFGANSLKYDGKDFSLKEIVESAIENVNTAIIRAKKHRVAKNNEITDTNVSKVSNEPNKLSSDDTVYIALDLGPTGKLLKPMGDLDFEDCVNIYKEVISIANAAGVDLIYIETMSDTYELKAAVLAAKEVSKLPVFATVVFDEKGKLLTGADVPSVVAMLEGLRVDALGINCGMGPIQMKPILEEIISFASIPIIVKPNAGLPKTEGKKVYYDIDEEMFSDCLSQMVDMGVSVIGGCCGTTPKHIEKMAKKTKGKAVVGVDKKDRTLVSSYGQTVELGIIPRLIGERINPTGKKKFKEALINHDINYVLGEAITQAEAGADILDVNVGLPDIDEASTMKEVVTEIQSITNLPLQIDTVDEGAMEMGLRYYNGKPMVNSVNGKQEEMDKVFPLIRKYGGVVVGLCIDEEGIPNDVSGRFRIANKIIEEAKKYGIDKKDIVIDALVMTISAEPTGAIVTLEAMKEIREKLGVNTILGVSNISFGLPYRLLINSHFFTMALSNGLSCGIVNPSSEEMMGAYRSYLALMNIDKNCSIYIENYANYKANLMVNNGNQVALASDNSQGNSAIGSDSSEASPLKSAVIKGLKEEAIRLTKEMILSVPPLDIINNELMPALDVVGQRFENGTLFLPQLLMSAEAAKAGFAIIQDEMKKTNVSSEKKEKVILATVKGDIHDIGKNIVKVLLENYGFDVIDLGKDVAPETIVETAIRDEVRLVGLSALMTTTVVSMEETIRLLREKKPDCKVMVGGAVLNQDYADKIGADFYGKDAMQSVTYARSL